MGGVAFFDSGIGGLTVLNECRKNVQGETFYYYGDNHHAPYGNLSPKKIRRYVFRAFRLFHRLKVDAAVLACNTATALCIDRLRKKFSFPIIGVEPAVSLGIDTEGKVFVLVTRATYNNKRFQSLCQNVFARADLLKTEWKVFPCDGLAGEIERHILDSDHDYTPFLPRGEPSAVVLGCTHYSYLKTYITNFYSCCVLDGNKGVAKRLNEVLFLKNRMQNADDRDGRPPRRKKGYFRPFLSTFFIEKVRRIKTNKRSCFLSRKKSGKSYTVEGVEIYFLGKNASKNASIYKQMFGFE
ncbi:MAG: aspartate/glutamate racemase family protein [Clostridia bacterium]|nr:aspartate/glutamate racemase family protein [Clostridia bacterium]